MSTEDEPDRQTIAGRALRALRTTRAPAPEEDVPAPAPVDLTKPPEVAPEPAEVADPVVEEPTAVAEPLVEESVIEPVPSAGRRRNPLLLAAIVLVIAAVAYTVVASVVYFRGRDSSAATAAAAREDVLKNARIDIAILRTLDYRDPKDGLQKWLNVTTGDFHNQIASEEASQEPIIAKAKRVTVGQVLAAAVTELDLANGTASVIASVDTTITPAGQKSVLDRDRYRATLKKDHGVWKIDELALVPVGLS